MSSKMIGVVGPGTGWKKVGIELGSCVFYPNLSQPGMFQTFAGAAFYININKLSLTTIFLIKIIFS